VDYFELKQDERYANVPRLEDVFKKIGPNKINRKNAHKFEDTIIFHVDADSESMFLDILDRQLYLISEKLKKILEKYVPNTEFKIIPLIDLKQERQENYYMPIFEEVEALSESCEFNRDRSVIKKLVLKGEKIKDKKIFSISGTEKTTVIVRLDVAESVLRRDFTGIELKPVEVKW
jgi:hypothetical protein